eukprot:scaffold13770_cov18-Prasinocladus_malaysianus.AAC.1
MAVTLKSRPPLDGICMSTAAPTTGSRTAAQAVSNSTRRCRSAEMRRFYAVCKVWIAREFHPYYFIECLRVLRIGVTRVAGRGAPGLVPSELS